MRQSGLIFVALIAVVAAAIIVFRQLIVMDMPGRSYRGLLEPLSPDQAALASRLEQHVAALAGEIGERNLFRQGTLERAFKHIEDSFIAAGLPPVPQHFEVSGHTVSNIEATIQGKNPEAAVVVIGAHYDSVQGSPGANDNASGVAALLEIGRALQGRSFKRGVRLVAFVNEEAPFSYTESMGSVRYARRLMQQSHNVAAMVSLETVGYYTDNPGSQRYPFPLSYFYPDTGNFIGFVGNPASKSQVRRMVRSFRENTRFPSEGLAAPERIPGVGWSDHWAFWRQGLPAVMVTDTAFYRYHEYHTSKDMPRILAYDRMARVVKGLVAVIVDLADRD
jgi:hypothetical protein